MLMTMRQIEVDTKNTSDDDLRFVTRISVPVTVSRDLIDGDVRIFLRHSHSVIVMIAKMDHCVRLNDIQASAHKAKGRMRVG